MTAERLDVALVSRGIVRSRAQAKELVAAGDVLVDGLVERKPSTKVAETAVLSVEAEIDHYVGRAAHKLLAALDAFPPVAAAIPGVRAVDVGASTGGFTQVLLERGASHVVALDVGHDQLAAPLRDDPRVVNIEGLNIRDVIRTDQLDGSPFPLVVSDLSFISLTLALPNMRFLVVPEGHLVALVKPQFEVGRERLGRTGVVTSTQQRRESILKVLGTATDHGLSVHGLAWSPMVGSHGNHEYLAYFRPSACPGALNDASIEARITELVEGAAS